MKLFHCKMGVKNGVDPDQLTLSDFITGAKLVCKSRFNLGSGSKMIELMFYIQAIGYTL